VGLISIMTEVKGITRHKNQQAIFMYLFIYHDTQMVLDGYPLGIMVKNNLGISKSNTPTFVGIHVMNVALPGVSTYTAFLGGGFLQLEKACS